MSAVYHGCTYTLQQTAHSICIHTIQIATHIVYLCNLCHIVKTVSAALVLCKWVSSEITCTAHYCSIDGVCSHWQCHLKLGPALENIPVFGADVRP